MNWVLILVIAILAGYTLTGYTKGFLKIVYSLVSWIVILVVVIVGTPYIEDYLKNNTGIYDKVVEHCETASREQAQKELEESSGGTASLLTENELFAAIAEKLPENLLENIKSQTSEMTGSLIEDYGIYNKTAVAMADLLVKGISTIAAIIAGAIVSALLSAVLGFIGHLPLIGIANKILGLGAGAANGLLIVWIAFYLVAVLCTTKLGSTIIEQIYASPLLTYLYENNVVLSLLT